MRNFVGTIKVGVPKEKKPVGTPGGGTGGGSGGGGGGSAYTPALNFTDARNSQYLGQVV